MSILENSGSSRAGLIKALAAIGILPLTTVLAGCGTPAAPQPPSLKLPDLVADLSAVRAGDSVTLRWTMPRKSTDRLLLEGPIPAIVCWKDPSGACQSITAAWEAPEAKAILETKLPAALLAGSPRPISLFVELKSPKDRSAGLSNPAAVLAGAAPGPVAGLTAEVRADGVALHWTGAESTLVRLHRTLLTPAPPKAAQIEKDSREKDSRKPAQEPILRDLLVEPSAQDSAPGALDHTARFGQSYEYTAQRLIRIEKNGTALELAGAVSAPVRIATVDTFPPAIPTGLAAVFVPEARTIDLSWEPNTEEDLAGYIVYRADEDGVWKRISPAQPLAGSAYRDPAVDAGKSYRYAVTAVDRLGHESKRSAEAGESVPNP